MSALQEAMTKAGLVKVAEASTISHTMSEADVATVARVRKHFNLSDNAYNSPYILARYKEWLLSEDSADDSTFKEWLVSGMQATPAPVVAVEAVSEAVPIASVEETAETSEAESHDENAAFDLQFDSILTQFHELLDTWPEWANQAFLNDLRGMEQMVPVLGDDHEGIIAKWTAFHDHATKICLHHNVGIARHSAGLLEGMLELIQEICGNSEIYEDYYKNLFGFVYADEPQELTEDDAADLDIGEDQPIDEQDLSLRRTMSIVTTQLAKLSAEELQRKLIGLVGEIYGTHLVSESDVMRKIAESHRVKEMLATLLRLFGVQTAATSIGSDMRVGTRQIGFSMPMGISLSEFEMGLAAASAKVHSLLADGAENVQLNARLSALTAELSRSKDAIGTANTRIATMTTRAAEMEKAAFTPMGAHMIRWDYPIKVKDGEPQRSGVGFLGIKEGAELGSKGRYKSSDYVRVSDMYATNVMRFVTKADAEAVLNQLKSAARKDETRAKINDKLVKRIANMVIVQVGIRTL